MAVVVLHYNGEVDTIACLRSLAVSDWPANLTIVVDNGSEHAIEPVLAERFADVTVIRNSTNLGFAGGMNVGLMAALEVGAEYVLLLNNDTEVEASMLTRLVQAAQSRPDAGILSPVVLARDSRELIMSAGARFDPRRGHPGRPLLAGERISPMLSGVREVDASSGEAMFVSARAVDEVGQLDEALYVRLEDVDWSLRMRACARRNYVVLDALLWHGVSRSSGGEHSPFTAYYHTRNILFVCRRYAPMPGPRGLLREGEVLLANLLHARRGSRPLDNARAVIAAWRDYRHGRLGARPRA